jgi:hypothetical protein
MTETKGFYQDALGKLRGKQPDSLPPDVSNAVLKLSDWLKRDLPEADPLLGHWLTTTSRVMIYAPTGIGKTMLGLAIAMAIPGGNGFLKWLGRGSRRVLYIDGEMSSRLLKQRLADEVQRLGFEPEGLYVLSHEDIENFAPLNTPEGQRAIEDLIKKIGGIDIIMFDNIMSLIGGDMKEEDGWRQTLGWVKSLTKRKMGQIWFHHTGHEGNHSYGTKTREWQLDTVIKAEPVKREDTDVSFKLTFEKARERTPRNRDDFADITVALINEHWSWGSAAQVPKGKDGTKARIPKAASIGRRALVEAIDAVGAVPPASNYIPKNVKTVDVEQWRKYAYNRGISDGATERAKQLAFKGGYEYLLANGQIAVWQGQVWLLSEERK